MADAQMQVVHTPTIQMRTGEDLPLPPPSALEGLPPPPPKESFSKFQQQRQASELRRLYKHIHPELRKNLEEAVAEDLAKVRGSAEPTEGDVQCIRWIFENWSLDAIGDHERPAGKEPVSGGNVQATSRKFEEGSFTNSSDPEPGPRLSGGDVRATRQLFETKSLDALTGQEEATQTTIKEPAASGDVQGTRKLFETKPLDLLGSCPSIQEQSPLELRSEIQELKGDVKKTVKLFQTEPLCAIQDAEGAIHEVKAACREEIQSNAVRSARWLFETRPLDAFNQDPSQVRVIRGISLEEGVLPDVSATRWIFETQPLDAIREILVDEKDFQPSPDLIPPGPDVQHQRHLFETCALDTLKGERETEAEAPAKEEVIPGDVRYTLWLFETKPLDAFRDQVQVGHLQRVDHQKGEGPVTECLSSNGTSALPLSQGVPQNNGPKGDVKTFKNLFETLPLDSIGQGEPSACGNINRGQRTDSAGLSEGADAPVYAMQDSRGQLHALTSVSREQVVGGDVQGYKWMFETQPLDRLGRSPSTVDVVRGITRQEVVAGDVGTTRWLFETQPLEMIHQQEQQKREEEEGRGPGGPPPELPQKGDVQTIRWLFETYPMSELAEKQESEVTGPVSKAEAQSCTWMFGSQSLNQAEGSGEQHLQTSQVQAGDRQTDSHVFETESLPAQGQSSGRKPVRYCSRVEIPSGQVSRQKEVFQALEAGKREVQETVLSPGSIPTSSVHKFTWLFENCPMGSLAAESVSGGNLQEEQPKVSADPGTPERQETAAERTLWTLYATPGILHHGGILMETRGPGELCLAKYVLPSPGQGRPCVQKEELVCGDLPRIVCQVLGRTDVDQQGLLVQEDTAGQLRLHPLKLPGPGDPENIEDMDPELQQLLACGLGVSMAKTGLVMQETGQGLVALTAYSLQPQPTSRGPERSSVQLLASCIDKGELHSLPSLRWEPPTDSSSVPVTEETQRLPPTESIIRVTPLDSTMKMGHLRVSGSTPCPPPPRAAGKVVLPNGRPGAPLQEARKQVDISHAGQKGKAASGRPEGTIAPPLGSGAPNLQEAMQNLRLATAEAQSLHQQVLSRHAQGSDPAATSISAQDVLQVSTPTTTQGSIMPVAGRDARITAVPRKVSGDNKAVPRGLPRGWVTIQDGIYAAHPVRTSDPPGAIQPSEKEPQPRDSPPQADQGQSRRPEYHEPGGHTQRAWGPLGKVMPQIWPECLQAADTSLKTVPLTHHTLTPKPQAAGDSLHSHNASPPTLPAAVTEEPDHPAQGHHQKDSIQQASKPLREPLLHSHNRPAGQKTLEGSETKLSKAESTVPPRKKPPVPPKPAHLSQVHPPHRLPKPLAASASISEAGQDHKPGEPGVANPGSAKAPTIAGQGCLPLAECSKGQKQPMRQYPLSTTASRPSGGQTSSSNSQSPESRKLTILNNDVSPPQKHPSSPKQQPMDGSKQGTPESPEIVQGSHQELQGLLSQVQTLEKETAHTVDVQTLRKLFEAAPQLAGGTRQVPTAPHKTEVSVERAFGELTRVSSEVAQLKEQTLARLLDIEETVHKALSSISSFQSEGHTSSPPQGSAKDLSVNKVSTSNRARPMGSNQVKDPPAVENQEKVESRPEAQGQDEIRNHAEARGQAAVNVLPSRRLETARAEPGLQQVSPSCRGSSSPTFISIQSATKTLLDASNPQGSHSISGKNTHLAQDISQALLYQRDIQDQAGTKEMAIKGSVPTGQQENVLEFQTGSATSKSYGATKTVTEQYEEMDQFGNTVLTSSTTITQQAEPLMDPRPQLGLYTFPMLRQFLHSPSRFNSDLAGAEIPWVPCSHFHPAAQ